MNWKQWALPVLLVAAVMLNKIILYPPAPMPADSDPLGFSAMRAFSHIEEIATEPHAVGTPANKRVRDYLLGHLQAAGLEVEVQTAQIVDFYRGQRSTRYAATVHNIVARLKGSDPQGKALLLMSHYDSVYYGPGAGDDAAGTAVLLETLRAVQAGEPLENDVIFLITDAEEVGLFGAQAFFKEHRWAADAGLILNFEARGSKGPANMFQTGRLNDQMIKTYASAVKKPLANSLTVKIYQAMPNDTDLSISLADDIPGMNFAFIEGHYDYHTKGDNPVNLSRETVQHMGDQALAMTRVMGNKALPLGDTTQAVFFDFLSLFLVSYPVWISWIIAGFAVVLFGVYAKGNIAGGQLSLKGTLKSITAALVYVVAFALLVDLLFLISGGRSGDMVEGRRLFALEHTQLLAYVLAGFALALGWFNMLARGFSLGWVVAGGLSALLLAVFEASLIPAAVAALLTAMCYFMLKKPVTSVERQMASLGLYLLAALVVQFIAPVGSYLFIWPFIFVVGALMAQSAGKGGLLLFAASGMLGAIWLSYFTEMGYSALGLFAPFLIAVPYGLLLLLLVPTFLQEASHKMLMRGTAALTLALVAFNIWSPGFDTRYNRPTEVFYALDSKGDGINHFASRLKNYDPWAADLMATPDGSTDMGDLVPNRSGTLQLAKAPPSLVGKLTVAETSTDGGSTSFTLMPGFRGDIITVAITGSSPVKGLTLNGEALAMKPDLSNNASLIYFAVGKEGLKITVEGGGDLRVHATEITSAWPADVAASIPAKPEDVMIAPYRFSDSTISSIRFNIPKLMADGDE